MPSKNQTPPNGRPARRAPRAADPAARGNGAPRIPAPTPRPGGSVAPYFTDGYRHTFVGESLLVHADCMAWMRGLPSSCVHGVVTDPPYGLKEYDVDQLQKMEGGNGGIWRLPPSFDGSSRQPLPRFTALNVGERERISEFFTEWARETERVLKPGGHVLIACNPFLCQLVYAALVAGGLEFRGQIVRVVRTFRGGDRPKGAESEFPDVCSLPRGCHEPWGILRKALPPGRTVADCLKDHGTGALRRSRSGSPFLDVIPSRRTSLEERRVGGHPSLKPQELMRQLVWAVLPLGRGVILDPFTGAGSTVAAATALGLHCIGVERRAKFFQAATAAVPKLADLPGLR